MFTEIDRQRIRAALGEAIGEEEAGKLMEVLPPFPWDEIAKRSDLEEFRSWAQEQFDAIADRFDRIEARLGAGDLGFADLDSRLSSLETQVETGLGALDSRLSSLETQVETGLGALESRLERLDNRVDAQGTRVGDLGDRIGRLEHRMNRLEDKVDDSAERLRRVESRVTSMIPKLALINMGSIIGVATLVLAAVKLG